MNRYEIGRRIEAYRDRCKMSTQELAGRIRRSQATISRIENGKQGLTFELLATIASELRVHPFALLSDGGNGEGGSELERLRQVLSRIRQTVETWEEEEESRLLGRIRELLDSAEPARNS